MIYTIPVYATSLEQDDPAANCAEGVQLFFDNKMIEALPLLEAGFARRDQVTFAHPDDLGKCALALGVLYGRSGNFSGALETYQVALNSFQASSDREWEGITLGNIGAVYYIQGRYAEALDSYQQALVINRETGDRAGEGATLYSIGTVCRRQGRPVEALANYKKALTIKREVGDRAGEGTTLDAISVVYHSQGRYAKALESSQQALTIWREVGDLTGEGQTLSNIGAVYHAQGRYAEALKYYQQALVIRREVGDQAGEGDTLDNIGGVYHAQGRYAEALEHYQQALAIRREVGDPVGEGVSLNNIGGIYDSRGLYVEALKYYQQALAMRREVGDQAGEGATLNNIAAIHEAQGRYAKALDSYQQALIISREMGDRASEGSVLHNLGTVYQNQGRYTEALDYLQQALGISREVGDRAGEGVTLHEMGVVYHAQGRYTEALDYLQQALTIRRTVGDRAGEGDGLNSTGVVYADQGRYAEALESHQQALAILREIGDRAGEGDTLDNIGWVYDAQGRYTEALENYQQALTIRRAVGDQAGEGVTLDNIGAVYQAQGRSAEALESYQQALAIRREVGDRGGEGVTINNIGLIYRAQGQLAEALDYLEQALAVFREVGNRTGEGLTLNNMGELYQAEGRYAEALDAYRRALVMVRKVGDQAGEGAVLNNIGMVYRVQGQPTKALDSFHQAIAVFETIRTVAGSEAGRAGFIAQYSSTYRAAVELLHQQGQLEAAFFATEQGRARSFLDSLVTGQVQLSDSATAELLAQEQELYAHRQAAQDALAKAQAFRPPEPDLVADLESQLAEAEAAYEEVQQTIATRASELASLVPSRNANYVLGVDKVQRLLDNQTTLVSYYILEDKTLAFLLTKDDFQVIPLPVSREQLINQITAFRDFSNVDVAFPDSVITLYRWLIEPLKQYLKTSHLAIIPHSILHYLPFAALTDGQRYLIDDYTLTTLPSASSLPFIQKNAQQTAYTGQPIPLVLGNPTAGDYDTVASLATTRNQLGSLPYAEKEAKAITKLLGVEPLIGQAATESAVREQVSHTNILHLAAHGKYNPVAPLNSLIALAPDNPATGTQAKSETENPPSADGWLTVGEVYGLDLKKTDLVVLSACETNLGDLSEGDELVGLTRAFIFAGTPSVIASLWNVEDEATSLLMERFYTHLRDGMGKAEALRQAQIEVRQEYPNPYFWAAFVLSGNEG